MASIPAHWMISMSAVPSRVMSRAEISLAGWRCNSAWTPYRRRPSTGSVPQASRLREWPFTPSGLEKGTHTSPLASNASRAIADSARPAWIQKTRKNPLFLAAKRRSEAMAASNDRWRNPRIEGELPDIYLAMGQTAENVATLRGISRLEQDEFGVRSQNLAEKAIANGVFEAEIAPVTLPDGNVFSRDDGPRPGTTMEAVAALPPVFRADGTVTAGNCCPLNDGAAAVVIMSDVRAAELGLRPLARIVATGVSALSPEIMGLGPVEASRRA